MCRWLDSRALVFLDKKCSWMVEVITPCGRDWSTHEVLAGCHQSAMLLTSGVRLKATIYAREPEVQSRYGSNAAPQCWLQGEKLVVVTAATEADTGATPWI